MAIQVPAAWKNGANSLLSMIGMASDQPSMKGLVLRNASWLTIGYGAEIFIRFCSSLILTRLLDPGAYGLISTVTVFIIVATMLSELGIRQIVMTDERGDQPEFLQAVWTIEIVRGIILTAILALIALGWYMMQLHGWISHDSPYANPLLPALLGVTSLSLAGTGLASTNMFRLAREMDQGAMTRIEIAARLAASLMSVGFTLLLHSVWGVAIAITLGAFVRSLWTIQFLPGPKMKLRLDWAEVSKIMLKSRWLALGSGLSVLTSSGDKILLGYGFGIHLLGVFSVAMYMVEALIGLVGRIQATMGISLLYMIKDQTVTEQHAAYYRFRLPIDAYCLAVGLGLVLFGPLFFSIMYDPRYHLAGHYAALLGLSVFCIPLTYSQNFALTRQQFKYLSFTAGVRTVIFFSLMALAIYIKSMDLAVITIALQRLPECLLFFLMPRAETPFRWNRDGLMLFAIAVSLAFCLYR